MSASEEHAAAKRSDNYVPAYESFFAFHAPDLWRLLGLLAIPLTLLSFGPMAAVVMLFTCGATWLLRFYSASRWQDALSQPVLLAAGFFSVAGTYDLVFVLDLVVHYLALWVLTLLAHNMSVFHRLVRTPDSLRFAWAQAVNLTGIGALLAVIWEIAEWIAHVFVSDEVTVGYADTIGDVAVGVLGAATAAGFILHRRLHALREQGK